MSFSNKFSFSKDFPKLKSSIKIENTEECNLADSFTSRNPHWKHLMTKCNVEDHCTLVNMNLFSAVEVSLELSDILIPHAKTN